MRSGEVLNYAWLVFTLHIPLKLNKFETYTKLSRLKWKNGGIYRRKKLQAG
jgi:hypothetical protein